MRDERTPKDVCGEVRKVAEIDALWFALGAKASWSKITNGKKTYRVLPSSQNLEATGAVGANLLRASADLSDRFAGVPNVGKPLYRETTVYSTTHKTIINRPMDQGKLFFYWNPFIFVGYGNDRFLFHTNPDISNVMQQCRCSRCLYFELGLPVVPLWRVWLWFSSILVWDRV